MLARRFLGFPVLAYRLFKLLTSPSEADRNYNYEKSETEIRPDADFLVIERR